ncbi:AAA family ATPase [Prescottella subtropica]|uniref:AAA family ATPase n=1 Tax=Prescottella subtropica TaxID=2545757 RepID=UPI0013867BF3|nr:ATP-binding protein [Prescottella subtropica]
MALIGNDIDDAARKPGGQPTRDSGRTCSLTRPHLVVVCGLAGVGKSEISRRLAKELRAVFLDKDTLAQAFTEELLQRIGCLPHDRESGNYLSVVRPLEYQQLEAAAAENVALGMNVVTTAPYMRETQDPDWYDAMLEQVTAAGAVLKVVWVRADPAAMRSYIEQRNDPRDQWKRSHWDEYISSTAWDRPPRFPHTAIDNSTYNADSAPIGQILGLVEAWEREDADAPHLASAVR